MSMTRSLILDTNLSLVFIIGIYRKDLLGKHKRVKAYDIVDFRLLIELIEDRALFFTPNILTETSNLIRQIEEPAKGEISNKLAEIVKVSGEIVVGSRNATSHKLHPRLGITDAGLLWHLEKEKDFSVLTDDLDLYLAGVGANLPIINFTHFRRARKDF